MGSATGAGFPYLAVLLALLLPAQLQLVLLVHGHDGRDVHVHFAAHATDGAALPHHHGDEFVRDAAPASNSALPRVNDGLTVAVPPGFVLILEREGDLATAPCFVEPPASYESASAPPPLPDVNLAEAGAGVVGSDHAVRTARPPPRHGLELLLVTSRALLL